MDNLLFDLIRSAKSARCARGLLRVNFLIPILCTSLLFSACGGSSTTGITAPVGGLDPVGTTASSVSVGSLQSSSASAANIKSSSTISVSSAIQGSSSVGSKSSSVIVPSSSSVVVPSSSSSVVTPSSTSTSSSAVVVSSSVATTSSSVAQAVLASLEIAPGAVSLAVNSTQQLVAVGKLSGGTLVNMYGKVTWSLVSGTGVVSISSSGLLKRLTAGDAVIQASAQGKTATLSLTDAAQAFTLNYDNSTSKWAKVSVYLWTGTNTEVAPWPGTPMTNNNGVWTYTVSPSALVNGKINVIFNNGEKDNTLKTVDQLNVAGAASYKDGVWTPSSGGTTALVSVLGGSIKKDGVLNSSGAPVSSGSGSVLTISAKAATTSFASWAGTSAAYIFTDPSKAEAQLVVPSGVTSMVLQALYVEVVDTHKVARNLYAAQCVSCHGVNGSGGPHGGLTQLSTNGTYTLTALINKISTMPVQCAGNAPGGCAYDIASMILANEWKAAVKTDVGASLDTRNLRLLTTEEYLNSARDILGVNFDADIMSKAVGDSTARNFNTASTLSLDYDRTVGYQMAARIVAEQTIAAKSFFSLVGGCGSSDTTCVVTALGKKVFRRPLTSAEVSRYVGLYESGDAGKAVIEGLLISPHFMYRSEMGTLDTATGLYRLNNYEIATLLSYSFWASAPDDALLAAAASSTFDIKAQATRLLSDARADRGLRRFAEGWFLNSNYGYVAVATPTLAAAFNEETIRFVMETIKADMPYETLLTANYTYANTELANFYKIQPASSDWGMTSFTSGDRSVGMGVLGQGSFLATRVSSAAHPSPIKRGTFVRSVLMCQELDPPQAAGVSLPKGPEDTNRMANVAHTKDPACQGCHQYIDGIGFGFEKYGSNALYRETETLMNGTQKAIDASGSIKSLNSAETKFDPNSELIAYQTVPELAKLIANSGQGSACYSRQFYRYIVGRNDVIADEKIIPVYSVNLRGGGGMKQMLIDLTLTPSFILRSKYKVEQL